MSRPHKIFKAAYLSVLLLFIFSSYYAYRYTLEDKIKTNIKYAMTAIKNTIDLDRPDKTLSSFSGFKEAFEKLEVDNVYFVTSTYKENIINFVYLKDKDIKGDITKEINKYNFFEEEIIKNYFFKHKFAGKNYYSYVYLYRISDHKVELIFFDYSLMFLIKSFADNSLIFLIPVLLVLIMALIFFRLSNMFSVQQNFIDLKLKEARKNKKNIIEKRRYFEKKAKYDPLTKLLNKEYIHKYFMEKSECYETIPLCVMIVDLDTFKTVNDTWGHYFGDQVLQEVAQVLKKNMRTDDAVGRIGGDEFMLVYINLTKEKSRRIAERITEDVKNIKFITPNEGELHITCSAGILEYTGQPPKDFLIKVDEALYKAKEYRGSVITEL